MGETIVVLGAGGGTGRAIAKKYASEGFKVALVARREAALTALAEELRSDGATVAPFVADITDPAVLDALFASVRDTFGSIDVLAFTAASESGFTPAVNLGADQVREFAELFLYPVVESVRFTLEDLKKSDSGAILYVNGASALGAPAGMSGPAPSLAAARNYLMTLRDELAEFKVFVGAAFIAALIKGSAAEASARIWDPEGKYPIVDPALIAASLFERHSNRGNFEAVLPSFN